LKICTGQGKIFCDCKKCPVLLCYTINFSFVNFAEITVYFCPIFINLGEKISSCHSEPCIIPDLVKVLLLKPLSGFVDRRNLNYINCMFLGLPHYHEKCIIYAKNLIMILEP